MKQVFLKNGPQKGGRPTNGVTPKLETLKAPERMNEEQEGTFNQHNLEGVNYFTPCYCYH